MMAKRRYPRGHVLAISMGPRGLCPDCGEATPFHSTSLLGDDKLGEWFVDRDLLRSLAISVTDHWSQRKSKIFCRKCRSAPIRLYWIEKVANAVVGPYCSVCLRTQRHDLPVFAAPAARSTYKAACAINYFQPKAERVTVDANVHLF